MAVRPTNRSLKRPTQNQARVEPAHPHFPPLFFRPSPAAAPPPPPARAATGLVQMDVLYSQLYEKYKRLKTEKDSVLDGFSREQESKFANYVSAAEEIIENLKRENETLKKQRAELSGQISTNREAERQFLKLQQLLDDEKEKAKALSEEVAKFQKLSSVESQEKTERATFVGFNEGSRLRPFTRQFGIQTDDNEASNQLNFPAEKTGTSDIAGYVINGVDHENCLFQTLLQSLVGLKFSLSHQVGNSSVSVLHQSSGYSFLLKMDSSPGEGEGELLYHVISLGTFDRVAPEWMREDMIFRLNMCPIFFERLLKVIKRRF